MRKQGWIRQRISPYCFGVKTAAGNPAHCNRNADVLVPLPGPPAGLPGAAASAGSPTPTWPTTSPAPDLLLHRRRPLPGTDEVLINIDIDCHKSGSLAGAIAFAEHLRATRFPGLYFEASTNGNGVHGYIVVVKGDLGDQGLNATLGQLDRWLKAELARGDWDVEAVEVKGQAPVFSWGREKYELLTYRSGPAGQAAPRGAGAGRRADGHHPGHRNELRRLRVCEATRNRRTRPAPTAAVPSDRRRGPVSKTESSSDGARERSRRPNDRDEPSRRSGPAPSPAITSARRSWPA